MALLLGLSRTSSLGLATSRASCSLSTSTVIGRNFFSTTTNAAAPSSTSAAAGCPHHQHPQTTSSSPKPQDQQQLNLKPMNSMPKAAGWLPLVGNIVKVLRNQNKFHEVMHEGRHPEGLSRFKAGPFDALLVSEPQLCQQVLMGKAWVDRPRLEFSEYFREKVGLEMGMAFSNGHAWDKHRKIANRTLLMPAVVETFAPAINKISDEFVEKWKKLTDKPLAANNDLDRYTLDAIGNLAFGIDFGALKEKQNAISEAIQDLFVTANDFLFAPIPYWKYLQTPSVKKCSNAMEAVANVGTELVQKGKNELEGGMKPSNYLHLLLQAKGDDGSLLSTSEILGNLLDVIVAGQETTATTLAWSVHLLAKYPEIQEKLYQEVSTASASLEKPNYFSYGEITGKRFPYLANFVKEVLRLYPAASAFGRTASVDTELGGYSVPSGITAIILPYTLGRDPKFWKDPLRFHPDRFSEDHTDPLAWLPFGGGRRSCVGQRISLLETKVLLAKIVANFKVEPAVAGEKDPDMVTRFTTGPDRDIMIRLKPRNP